MKIPGYIIKKKRDEQMKRRERETGIPLKQPLPPRYEKGEKSEKQDKRSIIVIEL